MKLIKQIEEGVRCFIEFGLVFFYGIRDLLKTVNKDSRIDIEDYEKGR